MTTRAEGNVGGLVDSRLIRGSKATISRDIYVGDTLAFAKGENVQIENLSKDKLKPDNKYVVLSPSTGTRYLLADADLIPVVEPSPTPPKYEVNGGTETIMPADSVVLKRDVYVKDSLAFNKGEIVKVMKTVVPKGGTRIGYVLFSSKLGNLVTIWDDVLRKVPSVKSPEVDAKPSSKEQPERLMGGPPPRRASPIPQSSLPIKSLPPETVRLLVGAGIILIIAGIVLLAVGYNMGSDWRRVTSAWGTSSNIRNSWEPPSPEEKSAQTGETLMWVGGFAVLIGIAAAIGTASTNRQQREAQVKSEIATHKTCPFCSENILSSAIKCRYCGSNLEENRNE